MYRYIVVSKQGEQVLTSGYPDYPMALQAFEQLSRVMAYWTGEVETSGVTDQVGLVTHSKFTPFNNLAEVSLSIVRVW